jgi:hypothetical protein
MHMKRQLHIRVWIIESPLWKSISNVFSSQILNDVEVNICFYVQIQIIIKTFL